MGSAHEAYDAVMGPRARRGVRVSPPEPGGKDPMALFTAAETAAMRRALRLAASPDAPPGPNPRVGCVIVSAEGRILAEGHHRGAGTAHAEVDALTRAGERAQGVVEQAVGGGLLAHEASLTWAHRGAEGRLVTPGPTTPVARALVIVTQWT